jgi:hypothetical protein
MLLLHIGAPHSGPWKSNLVTHGAEHTTQVLTPVTLLRQGPVVLTLQVLRYSCGVVARQSGPVHRAIILHLWVG